MDYLFWLRTGLFIIVLALLFYSDFKAYFLPAKIIWPAWLAAVIFNLALGFNYWQILLGAVVGFIFFFSQYYISKGKMLGYGDVNLGVLIGLMLGWPQVLLAIFLAYMLGGLSSLILLILRIKKLNDKLPLGSFLCLATIFCLLWGDSIWQIILKL